MISAIMLVVIEGLDLMFCVGRNFNFYTVTFIMVMSCHLEIVFFNGQMKSPKRFLSFFAHAMDASFIPTNNTVNSAGNFDKVLKVFRL